MQQAGSSLAGHYLRAAQASTATAALPVAAELWQQGSAQRCYANSAASTSEEAAAKPTNLYTAINDALHSALDNNPRSVEYAALSDA